MFAITVTGLVDQADLGLTLPHEHLYCDCRLYCTDAEGPATPMESVPRSQLAAEPMRFAANLDMRDERVAERELGLFGAAGGRTLVEVTTVGLSPDLGVLRRLAERTHVNVIAGTGYYIGASHPQDIVGLGAEQLAARMVTAITKGSDESGIRAGVIGEIGTSDPLEEREATVVRAAAAAQLATGCPITLHFVAGGREVFTVLDILRGEGIHDFSRVIVGHADDVLDLDQHRRIAETGAMVEYDTFGNEEYPNQHGQVLPSDLRRLDALAELVNDGLVDRLLISQDVCMKSLWTTYGGYGYVDVVQRLVPHMEERGLNADVRHRLSVENPGRIFAFAEA
jgi:phosphotriesterase-related protein